MHCREPLMLRLPKELKDWVKEEAQRNYSSQNSEVVRALLAAKKRADQKHAETASD